MPQLTEGSAHQGRERTRTQASSSREGEGRGGGGGHRPGGSHTHPDINSRDRALLPSPPGSELQDGTVKTKPAQRCKFLIHKVRENIAF